MKALVSLRPFSLRLDFCLVLACCLVLLGSRACLARTVVDDVSVTKVEEVQRDAAVHPVVKSDRVDEEQKSADKVDSVNDNEHRTVSRAHVESEKKSIDAIVRDTSVSHDADVKHNQEVGVNDGDGRNVEVVQTKRVQKLSKRLTKRPVRRIKRDNQEVSKEAHQIADTIGKSVEDKKSVVHDHLETNKRVDVGGIRRLDVNVEEEERKEIRQVPQIKVEPIVSEAIHKSIIHEASIENKHEIESAKDEQVRSQVVENESTRTVDEIIVSPVVNENLPVEDNPVIGQTKAPIAISGYLGDKSKNSQSDSNSNQNFTKLNYWKDQALQFQEKIRNNNFLQYTGQSFDILPGIPVFSENTYLDILKNIMTKNNILPENNLNIDALKNASLSDTQLDIVKRGQQLVTTKQRPSFFDNISQCIQGLSFLNCMRIFIYPIIVDFMPEALTESLSNLPIQLDVADIFLGNRDKTKTGRQVPLFSLYMNPIDSDAIIYNTLMEGLLRNPPNEKLPSFIGAKNESFSKLLTCNRIQLLQMTEKFLPENARASYSDEMLSCVKRFEYFSCLKYFSWPAMKQYYSALPQFPLSESYLQSLNYPNYPNYPLITYPGLETGFSHLPEIVDTGLARMKPETVIFQIFKKTLNDYARVTTSPTPIQRDLLMRNQAINAEQIATIQLAEQLLPINLRYEYVTKTVQCIRQYDYYNCMKYSTWPVLRQYNPSFPEFPNYQEWLNNFQELPGISNLFNFFSQFQLPQFQFPQFQFPQFSLPEFPFSLPDFSNYFPGGQQPTTPKPTVESPPANSIKDNTKNNIMLESNAYKILKNVRDTMGATPLSTPSYTNRKVFLFPLMTEDQSKIFALAESILPPLAREPLITSTYFCLNDKNEFTTCLKTIVWPFVRSYVKGLPEFPTDNDNFSLQQKVGTNVPFMSNIGSGDNFFIMTEIEKFFFEGREDAMKYVIRSIQLSSPETFNMQKLLEILRSIQFKTPEFLNNQMIDYPRLPEFSSILTKDQENIVHAVESIIPEQIRPKFYNDMIQCAQKNKFPVCSRNIIFPAIYRYFQYALSAPYNSFPTKKNDQNRNDIPSSRLQQGLNEKEFMYPDPESVIMSIIRNFQLNTSPLPDFPKKSIANTPEFMQLFSLRQAHILTVAEGILPDEYRKGFLEEMFKCQQRDSFLNCSRNTVFPTMRKAYPDFPLFPDFENDMSRSKLSVIENLNRKSPAQNSYISKRTLPSLDLLYKQMPQERRDSLKLLIDNLPDTLYYDISVKMAQCTQFSEGISCGRDIVYTTLKKYYDAPDFNIDEYYPISPAPIENQRASQDYEIYCENMGFICNLIPLGLRFPDNSPNLNTFPMRYEAPYTPFGKLPDGSRIFKRTQEMWNPNITASVGGDKASFAVHISERNLMNFPSPNEKNASFENTRIVTTDDLMRKKRNIDDLLDSYSDTIPNDKKSSVPRRIPPKSTFVNITESELFQILSRISKHTKAQTSEDEDLTSKQYAEDIFDKLDRELITADQYEILKLVQGLNAETGKASFMRQVFQCIKSLSFIRCMGIFVWPIIVSNFQSVNPFQGNRDRRDDGIESQIGDYFGVPSSKIETELMNRKKHIESNLVDLYKTLSESKFEMNIGPLKVKGHGDGEVAISYSGFREGRLAKLKDNKHLPGILTIISEVIEEIFGSKSKNRNNSPKKDKKSRSLQNIQESHFEKLLRHPYDEENSERSAKDEQVINILLEKLRPSVDGVKDEDLKHYLNLEDAYRAFQVLFGPKTSTRLTNQLTPVDIDNIRDYQKRFKQLKQTDALKLFPYEDEDEQLSERLNVPLPKGRAINKFQEDIDESSFRVKDSIISEDLSRFKMYVAEYLKNHFNINKKKIQTGLTVRLPKLDDNIPDSRIASSLTGISRDMKKKMKEIMPAAGLAVSFIVQLALSHVKAAASVATLLSNMALGSAMLGMVRDMIFGQQTQPNIKYIYETEKHDQGITWPVMNPTDGHKTPNTIYAPSPNFPEPY